MLSRDDYKNYLDEMMNVELGMADLYKDYASRVEDNELKETFQELSAEEMDHYNRVRDISLALLKEE